MENFSFASPAELYVATSFRRNGQVRYQRFDNAAGAIRHAIETLEPTVLRGTVLEVDEERYDAIAIRELYDSAAYPLARALSSASDARG
jgi:hypothetical protein